MEIIGKIKNERIQVVLVNSVLILEVTIHNAIIAFIYSVSEKFNGNMKPL